MILEHCSMFRSQLSMSPDIELMSRVCSGMNLEL